MTGLAHRVHRRAALKLALLASGTASFSSLLAACSPAATPAPAKPAESKPAAPAAEAKPAAAAAPPATVAPVPVVQPTAKPQAPADAGQMMKAAEPNPKKGGKLITAWGATTAHMDIHQGANNNVLIQLYDPLITKNLATGLRGYVPMLATKWEVSPDGKAYTFSLREGVKFHDGTPFTADDVVATFMRIIQPPQGVVSVFKDELAPVDKVEAVDPKTVKFTLKNPWTPFLEVIASPSMIVYPKKALTENNQDLRKVLAPGTGPWVFKDHKTGERWLFTKNPSYWNPNLPYLDELEMLHVPAWPDRGTAVLSDQASFSWNVSPQVWEEGVKRKEIGGVQVPCLNSHTVMLNNKKKPLDDPRVRRAIHLAVKRQDMFKALSTQEPVFLSRWMPYASSFSTPKDQLEKMPGYREQKDEDIATAKKLMADAGYANGFDGIDIVTPSVAQWSEINTPAFQDQLLRTLNIKSTIRVVERGLLSEEYKNRNWHMLLEGAFQSNYIDPTVLWTSHLKTGSSFNWSQYSNPKLDAVIDQLNTEPDETKRKALFNQGMDILDEDPPFFLIGFCAHSPMWQSYVKGMAMDQRVHVEWGRLDTAWLDK
ncbi:MAG: ABC transporter substrate-binding protein [Chloroflexota bacterium]